MIDETPVHADQMAHNRRIVAYVVACVAVPYGELYALFADASLPDDKARNTFNKRLSYLLEQKRLVADGRAARRIFTPGELANAALAPRVYHSPKPIPIEATAPTWIGTKATPRQVDLMFGPVYVPGPGPVLRPGALDHQQCKSLRTQR